MSEQWILPKRVLLSYLCILDASRHKFFCFFFQNSNAIPPVTTKVNLLWLPVNPLLQVGKTKIKKNLSINSLHTHSVILSPGSKVLSRWKSFLASHRGTCHNWKCDHHKLSISNHSFLFNEFWLTPVSKAIFMRIQWLTALLGMWEEKSEVWLQGGRKLQAYLELILKHQTCFIPLIIAYLLTLNILSITSFLQRLEDLGLTAFCFKNSLRCKQIVLLPMHMHRNKPREKKTLPPTGYLAINSSYVSNFLKNFLNMRKSHLHRMKDKATAVTLPCITMCVSYFLTKPLITQIIATNYIWRSN